MLVQVVLKILSKKNQKIQTNINKQVKQIKKQILKKTASRLICFTKKLKNTKLLTNISTLFN